MAVEDSPAAVRGARRAVFLDKDGTVVVDVPYSVDPRRMALTDGAGEGLRLLQDHGFELIVVSNQSGVARGFFGVDALAPVERRLRTLLSAEGVSLKDFRYCPHHPEGTVARYAISCSCRKPKPGMIEQAAGDGAIDLSRSWVVGDILDDVEAGGRAGCATALIDNGNETEWRRGPHRVPDVVARDLAEAARVIVARGTTWAPARALHSVDGGP